MAAIYGVAQSRTRLKPSTLAWKIPWTEEPGRLQSLVSLGVGHDLVTSLSLFTLLILSLDMQKLLKFNQIPLVYFSFYFSYSRRWVIVDLALIYVIECSDYVFL